MSLISYQKIEKLRFYNTLKTDQLSLLSLAYHWVPINEHIEVLNFRTRCRCKQAYHQNFAIVNKWDFQMMTAAKERLLIALKTRFFNRFSLNESR